MELYKLDPSLLQAMRPDLENARQALEGSGLLFIEPSDIPEDSGTRQYSEHLIAMACTYGLDSSDASILLDANRLGISDVVTFDKDFLRAQADFTIYTWL